MNILTELTALLEDFLPTETGVFSGVPPDEYLVLTPLADTFAVFADNLPQTEVQEVRISLYSKVNYISRKNQLVKKLLQADFTITDRKYIGHEDETGYFHVAIDVANDYYFSEKGGD